MNKSFNGKPEASVFRRCSTRRRLRLAVKRPTANCHRRGAILVWFVLVFPLLLGMTGLVVDAGLLMATYRHVQNSVDAAAIAAANDLVLGRTEAEAVQTATDFVRVHHELSSASVLVHTPPQNGPYAGEPGYVEVIAEYETSTLFIHLLRGAHKSQRATARAVAGAEQLKTIDGIIALDHRARPGLAVTGNAHFNVTGRVIVNSEGGGVDADGVSVDNGNGDSAAFVSPFGLVKATEVYVVGGANRPDRFENYEPGGPHPLKTGQLPVPDPLIHVPTPTVANGVINVRRGAPQATDGLLVLNNPQDDPDSPNTIAIDETTGKETMFLRPGIYSSIDIEGGDVRFEPGIYVLAAPPESTYSLRILGGEIEAQGIMFYNTTEEYDPITGQPDVFDGNQLPTDGLSEARQMRLNASLGFSPIDTLQFGYFEASPAIAQFNGMLIFQRRGNIATVQIQGFSGDGDLSGTVYAKWAHVKLPAGGTFNSQFVVGNLRVPGHGDLTINYENQDGVEAPSVFLVE